MLETYSNLTLITLDEEAHKKTCNYWYLIHHEGCSHTAFRSKAALLRWMDERKIRPTEQIPEPGKHAWQRLEGTYSRHTHLDTKEFDSLNDYEFAYVLSNGDYTEGRITTGDDGTKTVHILNVNIPRIEFDYRTIDAICR